jgi:uncharacterized membrane protein YcjF (UPF0283 family)
MALGRATLAACEPCTAIFVDLCWELVRMDVVHAAALLSALVGTLSVAAIWIAWRKTKARRCPRMIVVAGIVVLALLANLVVHEVFRVTRDTSARSAPEVAGTNPVRSD